MNMLGVHQPDFGYLLDGMVYNEGESIEIAGLIQPKAEGEIAFLLKKDLQGPGVTAADVLAATEGVMACFEVVDSRIQDWKIKIQDTVSDNASCGVFVLGDQLVDLANLDLARSTPWSGWPTPSAAWASPSRPATSFSPAPWAPWCRSSRATTCA